LSGPDRVSLPLHLAIVDGIADLALVLVQPTATCLDVHENESLDLATPGEALKNKVVDGLEERSAISGTVTEAIKDGGDLLKDLPKVDIDGSLFRFLRGAAACVSEPLFPLPEINLPFRQDLTSLLGERLVGVEQDRLPEGEALVAVRAVSVDARIGLELTDRIAPLATHD